MAVVSLIALLLTLMLKRPPKPAAG
jgi:hypothetical protein